MVKRRSVRSDDGPAKRLKNKDGKLGRKVDFKSVGFEEKSSSAKGGESSTPKGSAFWGFGDEEEPAAKVHGSFKVGRKEMGSESFAVIAGIGGKKRLVAETMTSYNSDSDEDATDRSKDNQSDELVINEDDEDEVEFLFEKELEKDSDDETELLMGGNREEVVVLKEKVVEKRKVRVRMSEGPNETDGSGLLIPIKEEKEEEEEEEKEVTPVETIYNIIGDPILRVSYINLQGLTITKVNEVEIYSKSTKSNILVLSEVRSRKSDEGAAIAKLREIIPSWKILFIPCNCNLGDNEYCGGHGMAIMCHPSLIPKLHDVFLLGTEVYDHRILHATVEPTEDSTLKVTASVIGVHFKSGRDDMPFKRLQLLTTVDLVRRTPPDHLCFVGGDMNAHPDEEFFGECLQQFSSVGVELLSYEQHWGSDPDHRPATHYVRGEPGHMLDHVGVRKTGMEPFTPIVHLRDYKIVQTDHPVIVELNVYWKSDVVFQKPFPPAVYIYEKTRCKSCGRGFPVNPHDKNNKPCPYTLELTRQSFLDRLSKPKVQGSLKCPKCSKIYSSQTHFEAHVKSHDGPAKFVCTVCGKILRSAQGLKNHGYLHTGEKPPGEYICTYEGCGKTFRQQSDLDRHMRMHTGETPYACLHPNCNRKLKTLYDLKLHAEIHTRPYQCLVPGCLKGFHEKHKLEEHSRGHEGKNKFVCIYENCGKSFISYTKRQLHHFNFHAKNTQAEGTEAGKDEESDRVKDDFPCELCGKILHSKDALRAHKKRHQPTHFVCNQCGEGFLSNTDLEIHALSHKPKEERIRCDFPKCDTTFTRLTMYRQHMKLVHNILDEAEELVLEKIAAAREEEKSDKTNYFPCDICGKMFHLKRGLVDHKRRIHNWAF